MGSCAYNGESCVAKGLLSGLIGGLVGTILMTQFQTAWIKAGEEWKKTKRDGEGQRQQQAQQAQKAQQQPQGAQQGEKEDATMKAAGKVASLAGRELSHNAKKRLGPVVHYSFGTLQGVVYGMVLEAAGCSGGLLAGVAFGAALFALADEVAVPALGLSGKPSESPLPTHLYALAAHLVYGVSTEVTRRGLRESL